MSRGGFSGGVKKSLGKLDLVGGKAFHDSVELVNQLLLGPQQYTFFYLL